MTGKIKQPLEMRLKICYFNLKEKYIRGQKDFDKERFEALHTYYKAITAR